MSLRKSSYFVRLFASLVNRKALAHKISEGDPQLFRQLQSMQIESECALRDQRKATELKEASLVSEAKAKTLDSYAGIVRKVVPMIALAYGLGVSFSYFFLAIKFFPSGMSLGDTLLYVFIALGYGLLSTFFIFAGLLVVLPVLAFDDGARTSGSDRSVERGRGVWVIPLLVAPMLLALTVRLLDKAFRQWFIQYPTLVAVSALVVALAIGICAHYRAWRLGAGEPTKRLHGFETWMPLGLANGLVFQWLYSFVIAGYGTAALVPILVSIFAGIIAWFAIDSFSASTEAASIADAESSKRNHWKLESQKGVWGLGLSIILGGVALGVGELGAQYAACAFYTALAALICFVATITFSPLVVSTAQSVETRESREPFSSLIGNAARGHKNRIQVLAILAVAAFSIPLLADWVYMDQKISIAVFSGLGLRVENTTVRLKGDALASLKAQARNSGIQLSICTDSDGSATVSPVNVLWHGLGRLSLLSIGKTDEDGKGGRNAPQMEVASEEVKVLRHQLSHCRDISKSVYFASGKVKPIMQQQENDVVDEVRSALLDIYPSTLQVDKWRWAVSDIIVTGFADPMQLGEGGNEYLARQRAACLASRIFKEAKKFGLEASTDFNLRWDGEGARLPFKTSCPLTGEQAALSECHAANRVAKVRLMLACKDADGKASESCKLVSKVPAEDERAEVAKVEDPNFGGRAKLQAVRAEKQCSELLGAQ